MSCKSSPLGREESYMSIPFPKGSISIYGESSSLSKTLFGVFSNLIVPRFSKGYSFSILLAEDVDNSSEPIKIKYLAILELSLANLMLICLEE